MIILKKVVMRFNKCFFIYCVFILLVFIAILSSFVRVFLVHFNLTVYLKDHAFEIYQGLFTKKSIILKKDKIQILHFYKSYKKDSRYFFYYI